MEEITSLRNEFVSFKGEVKDALDAIFALLQKNNQLLS